MLYLSHTQTILFVLECAKSKLATIVRLTSSAKYHHYLSSRQLTLLHTYRQFKVARYNNFVTTPSIFESHILKQIDLQGRYTRGVLLPEYAPGSFCAASTHEGSYCGSLPLVMVHTWKQTKETWCGIADIHQIRVWELVQN